MPLSTNSTLQKPELNLTNQEGRSFRTWIGEFVNWGVEGLLGKLVGAGCDIFFLMEFTFYYCSPDLDPLDDWAQKARLIRATLPDYIHEIRKLAKKLKRLETPERIQLLGKHINPQGTALENYAERLQAAMKSLQEEAGTQGSLRPFYLLCMSFYLRNTYRERWRKQWMDKSIHADIRDIVNAGFRTYGIDRDISEDQVRRACERFCKKYPELAKYAEKLSKERPIKCPNVYEKLYQDSFRQVTGDSAE